MDEKEKDQDVRVTQVVIGTDSDLSPSFMTLSVPIKRLSEDPEGSYTLRGVFDEAKQVALNMMRAIRQKQQKANGIIKPSDLRVIN